MVTNLALLREGVEKNSLSANLQSMIKNVPPGSKFTALQRQGGAPTPEEVGFTQDGKVISISVCFELLEFDLI